MGVKLVSSGGGSVEINPPATASNYTATMPAATGTVVVGASAVSAAGQIPFSTDGSSYTPTAKIVSGTAVASTSGTSIDFTSIPSWVKRITVMFNGVSTNGTSNIQIQVGSGSITTSGYLGSASIANNANQTVAATFTTGLPVVVGGAAATVTYGAVQICLISGNTWVATTSVGRSDSAVAGCGGGTSPALSGTLDRVRITTVNGTDTFDAGSINILYE